MTSAQASTNQSSNQSKSIVSVSKNVHWEIPIHSNSFFTESKPGKEIQSKQFCVSKDMFCTKWHLTLFPNGSPNCIKIKSYAVVLLSQVSTCFPVPGTKATIVRLTVVNDNKTKSVKSEGYQSREELKEGLGFVLFLFHEQILGGGFVSNGKMKVIVEITIEFEVDSIIKTESLPEMKPDFNELFENNDFTDFELKTSDGAVLKVHKCVLATRSPVFYAMLKTDMKEIQTGSADVPDISLKVMKELLRYIYCGEVENVQELASELVYAAEKYQLKALKKICLQELISSLDVGVVIESLTIAHQVTDASELFDKCLEVITSNYFEVKQSPEWRKLPQSLVNEIFDKIFERSDTLIV